MILLFIDDCRVSGGEGSVNELAEPFPISVQQGAPLREAVEWLEKYRRFWRGSFDRLDERLQATERGPENG